MSPCEGEMQYVLVNGFYIVFTINAKPAAKQDLPLCNSALAKAILKFTTSQKRLLMAFLWLGLIYKNYHHHHNKK
jgi:hypothetical protein